MVKEYGYEYDAIRNESVWKKTKGKVTYEKLWEALCLRSGRDALKTIAREFEPTKVYLPALACDSMVIPFEMYEHKVVYYKLNKDYSIDLQYLKSIIDDGLFLYMDYFGKTAITDNELHELRNQNNLIFIEDRTHNLIWDKKSEFEPEFIMASLRKWINVPDGGLLWSKRKLVYQEFYEDTSFAETRLKAQCMRNQYFRTGDESIKLEYRKIFSSVSDIMDTDKNPSRMSAYSYEIANSTNWDEIREKRKSNAELLIRELRKENIRLIQRKSGHSDLYVAFMINDRDYKQSRLSSKGIFNTIIWPLTDKQKTVCQTAKKTEEYMLAAPCDQRYAPEDMIFIANEIVKAVKEK